MRARLKPFGYSGSGLDVDVSFSGSGRTSVFDAVSGNSNEAFSVSRGIFVSSIVII